MDVRMKARPIQTVSKSKNVGGAVPKSLFVLELENTALGQYSLREREGESERVRKKK